MSLRIVCISDLHGRHKKLSQLVNKKMPEGDVLVVAGDVTPRGEINMLGSFLKWFDKQPYDHKILVAGNHDCCLDNEDRDIAILMLRESKIIYLEDSGVIIDGVVFYGSPWQPEFMNWSFNLPRGEALLEKWKMIPDKTDVLITHGPPWGILDESAYDAGHYGCKDLRQQIFNRIQPKAHIFGHFHLKQGVVEEQNIKFINATSVDEKYNLVNAPIVLEI